MHQIPLCHYIQNSSSISIYIPIACGRGKWVGSLGDKFGFNSVNEIRVLQFAMEDWELRSYSLNQALLGKWLWRYVLEESWRRAIDLKHGTTWGN